ncbi:hypothetical protein [Rhodoferax sp.]|uniref:hypothetical protein n=1 Tax=Rhodoferax sp. TaxID=50421 RepID=UPI002613DBF3|nr:hypothetical protein [Rhodoferax sp.]MDD2810042.1 hypothetical protein [Rhodoferax sp.]MDD4943304.1 hypothetical protein [Rhodoferax sp.]
MDNATPTLPTQNESYGFWCSMNEHASAAWPLVSTAIAAATGCEPEQVRAFLDSRHGRHFADDVQNGLFVGCNLKDAIDKATTKWMGWTIGRNTAKEYGIPHGMAYLTGFVVQAIDDETFA